MLLSPVKTAQQISLRHSQSSSGKALLIGISGIDGSGKGFIANEIFQYLRNENVALVHLDGWLNLPDVRFSPHEPAKHFYDHAIRFEEMFTQLILPLKNNRSIDLIADYTEETAHKYRREHYLYSDIDIILLEGIYLFKKTYRHYFDLAIWIESTFEKALERAIRRLQEGLSVDETIRAYEQIYFPAQHIHFQEDHPQDSADFTILNEGRS